MLKLIKDKLNSAFTTWHTPDNKWYILRDKHYSKRLVTLHTGKKLVGEYKNYKQAVDDLKRVLGVWST